MVELGVFVSKHATDNSYDFINDAMQCGFDIQNISDINVPLPKGISAFAAMGGDGTGRLGMKKLIESESQIPFLMVEGGTNNAFHKALVDEGATVTISDLQTKLDDPSQWKQMKPGLLGELIFPSDVGLGLSEPLVEAYNEFFRQRVDIGDMRVPLAAFASWIAVLLAHHNGVPSFNLYTASPFFGKHKMFPSQSIMGETLTNVQIKSKTKREAMVKLLWTFTCLGLGRKDLLKGAVNIKQQKAFEVDYPIKQCMIGGDYVETDINSPVTVRRADVQIPVAAVIFDRNSPDNSTRRV